MSGAEMEPGQKAAWTAAAVLLVASLGGAAVLAEWPLWGVQPDAEERTQLVQPTEGGTELWPYTAAGPSHDARTLGINVVIHGNSEDVRRAMMARSQLRWDETPPEEEDADPDSVEIDPEAERIEDVIRWREAGGAVRFTYVVVDGESRWIDESYQLHSGTYLGQRMHIRAYEDPQGEWTAMQAHDEHWDWFRLRHTVTGISDAQRELERDFMGVPFVEEVSRLPYENSTADSDGWVTIIRLSAILLPGLALGVAARLQNTLRLSRRLFYRHYWELALGASLFGLYLGVRAAGIWLELTLPDLPPGIRRVASPPRTWSVTSLPLPLPNRPTSRH
jgi:hypothetical protein